MRHFNLLQNKNRASDRAEKAHKQIAPRVFKAIVFLFVITIGLFVGLHEKQNVVNHEKDTPIIENKDNQHNSEDRSGSTSFFDITSIPVYSSDPYVAVNNNIPFFSDDEIDEAYDSFEYYSPLDDLGRCGMAIASVGIDLMPTEERGNIGMIKPSGWHTIRYDDLIDGKYLYNRCHLIGYQLCGENANIENLITGTRYLNVSGMLPFEDMVANYVHGTNNHVLYRVTPIFEGDNLLATGVLMEACSVEDEGRGIQFNVFCYNSQPGISINYEDGSSHLAVQSAKDENEKPAQTDESTQANEQTYILNKNSKRFHYPWCASVDQISEKNKAKSEESRDSLITRGYKPCGNCHP